jgi:hypothetical protein
VSPAIVLQVLQKERLPRSDEEAFALTMPLRTTTELQLDQATSCHGLNRFFNQSFSVIRKKISR